MSGEETLGSTERALGIALLVVGAVVLVVKILPAVSFHALLKLWPLALVWIGWRMIREDDEGDEDDPWADSRDDAAAGRGRAAP